MPGPGAWSRPAGHRPGDRYVCGLTVVERHPRRHVIRERAGGDQVRQQVARRQRVVRAAPRMRRTGRLAVNDGDRRITEHAGQAAVSDQAHPGCQIHSDPQRTRTGEAVVRLLHHVQQPSEPAHLVEVLVEDGGRRPEAEPTLEIAVVPPPDQHRPLLELVLRSAGVGEPEDHAARLDGVPRAGAAEHHAAAVCGRHRRLERGAGDRLHRKILVAAEDETPVDAGVVEPRRVGGVLGVGAGEDRQQRRRAAAQPGVVGHDRPAGCGDLVGALLGKRGVRADRGRRPVRRRKDEDVHRGTGRMLRGNSREPLQGGRAVVAADRHQRARCRGGIGRGGPAEQGHRRQQQRHAGTTRPDRSRHTTRLPQTRDPQWDHRTKKRAQGKGQSPRAGVAELCRCGRIPGP